MQGLYLLWWVREQHLSAFSVAVVLAAGDLAVLALEIPTGWFADRFGHRASLIIGSTSQVVGMLWCWLGRGIPGVVVASLLIALGDAFRSGADQALLYRSVVALHRVEEFQRIEARARAASLTAMVGQVVAGGIIVTIWGFAAGWIVETMLSAVGLALACAMAEPPASNAASGRVSSTSDEDATRMSRLGVFALSALVLPAAFIHGAVSATTFLTQTAAAAEPVGMTVLVASITLAEAAGSWLAMRAPACGARIQMALGIACLAALTAVSAMPAVLRPAVVALSFLLGLAYPLRAAAVQRLAADGVRARAASVASACDMAFKTVALTLAGRMRQ
jgi:MFS family permease